MRGGQQAAQGVFVDRARGELAAHIAARLDGAVDRLPLGGRKRPGGQERAFGT